jgi:hypothetical protein
MLTGQRRWAGYPIHMLVSVGTGKDVVARRERGGWGLVETFGELMIEFCNQLLLTCFTSCFTGCLLQLVIFRRVDDRVCNQL